LIHFYKREKMFMFTSYNLTVTDPAPAL